MSAIETGNGDIRINRSVVIPRGELQLRASRSGGPGGQHVNTSSTRVELVWNARASGALSGPERSRVLLALVARLDSAGNVRVVASDTRSQRRNRDLAIDRLATLVRRSLAMKKVRKRTKPSRGAVEARLAEKKHQSGKKRERHVVGDD